MRYLGWLVALTLLLTAGPAGAKSYRHPLITQTVTVTDSGDLEVVDRRTYAFDGEFHNAFLTIDPAPGGQVEFHGVEAVDGGSIENIRVEGNTLRWQYDARNEERTFEIRYRLSGEVQKSSDSALIDRQFLEPEHAPVDTWRFGLATAGADSLFKVFVITANGRVGDLNVQPEAGRADVNLDALKVDEWVRVRVLFDPTVVPGLAGGAEPRYAGWLRETQEETQNYRSATARRLAARGGRYIEPLSTLFAIPIVVIALLFSWWAFRTYRSRGVEPTVGDIGEYFREPAEEIPPAVVPHVMEQFSPGTTVAAPTLGATLLDFARRGFVSLREREKESFLGIGGGREVDFVVATHPDRDKLTSFEDQVWLMLQQARGEDDTVQPKELRKFFERHTTWMQGWCSLPREWYERTRGPLLAGDHALWMFLLIAGGIVLMAGLIVLGVFSRNQYVLMASVLSGVTAGLFGIICGASVPRWRPEALVRAKKWHAYRRFLSDFSAMADAPAEHYRLWDYHFVYATALGVSKSYLKNLRKLMEQYPDRFATPAWIMAGHHPNAALGAAGAMNSMQAIEANLASLQANLSALESALSTTTSSGGGFSGGGAGGSSGGGGASGAS